MTGSAIGLVHQPVGIAPFAYGRLVVAGIQQYNGFLGLEKLFGECEFAAHFDE